MIDWCHSTPALKMLKISPTRTSTNQTNQPTTMSVAFRVFVSIGSAAPLSCLLFTR